MVQIEDTHQASYWTQLYHLNSQISTLQLRLGQLRSADILDDECIAQVAADIRKLQEEASDVTHKYYKEKYTALDGDLIRNALKRARDRLDCLGDTRSMDIIAIIDHVLAEGKG